MENYREDANLEKKRKYHVTKANKLIQKTRYSLTLQEQKLLLFVIQKIQPNDKDFQQYEITIQEYCRITGISPVNGKNYRNIRKSIQGLRDKSFWITLDNGVESQVSWLNKVWLDPVKAIIRVRLDEDLKPYLLGLKDFFVSYSLYYVLAMQSQYSIRLYELLKSYGNLSEKTLSVAEIRKLLEIPDGKLERWVDIKRFAIEKAIAEINLLTDLNVDYIPIKDGKSVQGVEFLMSEKTLEKLLESELQIEKRINPKKAAQMEAANKIEVPMFNWLEEPTEDEIPEHTVPPADMAAAIKKAYEQLG